MDSETFWSEATRDLGTDPNCLLSGQEDCRLQVGFDILLKEARHGRKIPKPIQMEY